MREKCPYSEFFWPVFCCIRTEYEEIEGIISNYAETVSTSSILKNIIEKLDNKIILLYSASIYCDVFRGFRNEIFARNGLNETGLWVECYSLEMLCVFFRLYQNEFFRHSYFNRLLAVHVR